MQVKRPIGGEDRSGKSRRPVVTKASLTIEYRSMEPGDWSSVVSNRLRNIANDRLGVRRDG